MVEEVEGKPRPCGRAGKGARAGCRLRPALGVTGHIYLYISWYDTIMGSALSVSDYRSLAELRYQIRRYLKFSAQAAHEARLEPKQHQLLLAIKGLPAGRRPLIGELSERMQIRHHSTVELVNRLAAHGYVERQRGIEDRREVVVALAPKGERVLQELSLDHSAELRTQGPILVAALKRAMRTAAVKRGRNK